MRKEIFPGLTPVQVAEFYGFPIKNFSGKGQSIAIISLGGTVAMEEVAKDFRAVKIPMPAIKQIAVNPSKISKQQDASGFGETLLDIEVIGSLCPDAKITIYQGANPSGFAAAVKKAVDDDNDVISISWGSSESSVEKCEKMEAALKRAKTKGITVCVAAGDSGSSDARGESVTASDVRAHVEYPASSEFVLACGGTELAESGKSKTEIVWNNSRNKLNRDSGATGGGVSELFALPSWQSEAAIRIPSANDGKTGRVVPDVSALAAGGDWKIYVAGELQEIGGTSAVAPLWAAFFALVNESRLRAGKTRLGFINERLYKMTGKTSLFNDITSGHNRRSKAYPGYAAKPGFDACTGWGTPKGKDLFAALVKMT